MELLINIIVSYGCASLIGGIFTLINKHMDYKRENKKAALAVENEYKKTKETAYINAINNLLFLKRGFSITQEMLLSNSEEHQEYDEGYRAYRNTLATLRLYATDEIFNLYDILLSYKKYSYVSQGQWRLFEEGKTAFDNNISLLAKMMSRELGYRKFDENTDKVECPECGRKHDIVETCKCGMTFLEYAQRMALKNIDPYVDTQAESPS